MNMAILEEADGREGGALIALGPRPLRRTRLSPHASPLVVTQLLAIHDNHPQWRRNRRLDEVSVTEAYERQKPAPGVGTSSISITF